MPRATIKSSPKLAEIEHCYVSIPGYKQIKVKALPDISDSKGANYSDENIAGRSSPYKVYSYSNPRTISFTFHFYAVEEKDLTENMAHLRAIESCVYPRDVAANESYMPYKPPAVCKLRCGKLLADNELCVVLTSYSVKFPTDVAWDSKTYAPYRFDVDTTWEVVYASINLPGAEKIMNSGA